MVIHEVGIAALVSGVTAQVLKPFVELLQKKQFRLFRVFDSGGMPSSHTAVVTTLTFGIGAFEGVGSPLFTIALIMGLYFVFEATGLRQEVGHQARVLNEIVARARQTHHFDADQLQELIGHTWGEVMGGLAIGLLVAFIFF